MKNFFRKAASPENFRRIVLPILLVIVLIVIGIFAFKKPMRNLNEAQAKTRAEKFVNDYLMTSGNKATIKGISEEYGLYKLKIDIVSDVVDSYLSRDGKFFFPQALDIDQISANKNGAANPNATPSQAAASQPTVNVPKNDKPKVELFVMSYCPYGTQIEKGFLPVIAALGNKIDFELKFCSYAMHGEKELAENLTQYCLTTEQPAKLTSYLGCFLAAGDSASCLDKTGVDKTKLASCVSKTDKKYKVTENFNNKVDWQGSFPGFGVYKADNDKYQVGGSPTLVINGTDVQSNRDSASLLKAVCGAFKNQPKECQTTLSSASPAPGFGTGTEAASGAAAGCGQ